MHLFASLSTASPLPVMIFLNLLVLVALAQIFHVQATLSTTGFTVNLNGVSYFVPPKSVGSVPSRGRRYPQPGYGSFTPITVVTTNMTSYKQQDFSATLAGFKKTDDVYQDGFSSGMQSSCVRVVGA